MQKPQEKKDRSNLIPLVLLLLSGVCLFLFLSPDPKPTAKLSPAKSKEFEAKVNRHLFKTSQEIEMSRQKMKVETFDMADKGVRALPVRPEEPTGVDLSVDPRTEALMHDLGRNVRENSDPRNSNELIQTELFQQEQLQNYSEEYKREYARQFIENAKKAGYRIIVNDQFKVISVTPIRKPAQDFELFESNCGGAR